MEEKKLAVVALGGNAILRGNQKGTVEEQNQNIRETLENLIYLVRDGYNLVITHGNGPQVGMIQNAMDNLIVMEQNYKQIPLPTSVAMSQGYIGYHLQQALSYALSKRNRNVPVVTLTTQMIVEKADPAFQNPTKRHTPTPSPARKMANTLSDSRQSTSAVPMFM